MELKGTSACTRTGTAELLVVPSPSSPNWLAPQHQASPAAVSPHVELEKMPTPSAEIWVKQSAVWTAAGAVTLGERGHR